MTQYKDIGFSPQISPVKTIQSYGKSFSFAGFFLSKKVFNDAARLYKFCRIIDDIADLSSDSEVARSHLNEIYDAIISEKYNYSEWLSDYLNLSKKYEIPKSYTKILIDGVLSDIYFDCISDERELINYCFSVAGIVGLMMCKILNVDIRGRAHAIDMGIAMQLTNISRDVLEDARVGRKYIPDTWLHLGSEDIISPDLEQRNETQKSIKKLLKLAEKYYESGNNGLYSIPIRSRIAIKFASDIYRGIGIKIKDNGYNYLDGREYLSKYEKLKIIFFSIIDIPKILFIKKNHNHVRHSLLKDEYLSELK